MKATTREADYAYDDSDVYDTPTATTTKTDVVEGTPSSPLSSSFEARVDVRATVSAIAIASAFFIVNRRVAFAVEKRRAREALEARRKDLLLQRLSGSASMDDEKALEEALEEAWREEAEAREFGSVFGSAVRVRMPQPLGRALSEVEEEEAKVRRARERTASSSSSSEERDRANRREELPIVTNVGDSARTGEENTSPPWWMTSISAVVLVLLTWSAVGLNSVDRVAQAPALTPEEIAQFRR